MISVLVGDCLDKLRELPPESVHCCVTSPPYYGLRDYGTATWEGGDPECDHKGPPLASEKTGLNHGNGRGPYETATIPYRAKCGKCGATRQDNQIGLEPTPEEHIAKLVEVFREVRRVLRKDGVLWLNYGDAYAQISTRNRAGVGDGGERRERWIDNDRSTAINGAKPKDLLMLPARVALALQADGWWLRSMLPWVKRSAMPESVTDRPATAIEYVFLLAKSQRYYFDMEAVRQDFADDRMGNPGNYKPDYSLGAGRNDAGTKNAAWLKGAQRGGRNFRNSDLFYASLEPPHGLICGDEPLALDVNPAAFSEAHFATFSPKLVEPLIKAATSEKGVCAECGAPWVREVALGPQKETAERGKHASAWRANIHGPQRSANGGLGTRDTKTTGWAPSCACDTPGTVPATILDCFGGAGTVGLVADRLKRNSILIELNPEYADMAKSRIRQDAGMFAELD